MTTLGEGVGELRACCTGADIGKKTYGIDRFARGAGRDEKLHGDFESELFWAK